jgi:hypothetical protein
MKRGGKAEELREFSGERSENLAHAHAALGR